MGFEKPRTQHSTLRGTSKKKGEEKNRPLVKIQYASFFCLLLLLLPLLCYYKRGFCWYTGLFLCVCFMWLGKNAFCSKDFFYWVDPLSVSIYTICVAIWYYMVKKNFWKPLLSERNRLQTVLTIYLGHWSITWYYKSRIKVILYTIACMV